MNRSLLTKIVICILTLMLTTALTFAEGFSAQGSDPTMSVVKVLADAYSKKTGAEIKLDGGGSSKGAKAALEGVKILKVNGIAPTEATLRDKRYPIADSAFCDKRESHTNRPRLLGFCIECRETKASQRSWFCDDSKVSTNVRTLCFHSEKSNGAF